MESIRYLEISTRVQFLKPGQVVLWFSLRTVTSTKLDVTRQVLIFQKGGSEFPAAMLESSDLGEVVWINEKLTKEQKKAVTAYLELQPLFKDCIPLPVSVNNLRGKMMFKGTWE